MIDPVHVQAYEAQSALTAGWIAAADPEAESRLPGWSVAHLAVHVALSGSVFTTAVEHARPPRGTKPMSVAQYLAGYAPAAAEIDEREGCLVAQGFSLSRTRDDLVAATAVVVDAARSLGDSDPVLAGPRGPVRASDLFRTRLVELVVHALDVDGGPALDRQAVRATCRLFAEVLAERHPGRSVELRVPPYAAVQIGETGGPIHTRGTPPNVVELPPELFVAVASGRRRWEDAVDSGEARASGSRADLSAYLPVL